MATLYVTEFTSLGNADNGQPQIARRPGTTQTVAIGASSTQSAAFNAATRFIRLHTDAICSTAVSDNPTATTASERMPADAVEYFSVRPGDKIAVIANT